MVICFLRVASSQALFEPLPVPFRSVDGSWYKTYIENVNHSDVLVFPLLLILGQILEKQI
jgi:hypothetical protein